MKRDTILSLLHTFENVSHSILLYSILFEYLPASLGGALATLFAFYASTSKYWDNFSPFPVICVSVASPIVGDYSWRCAFMLQGKPSVVEQQLAATFSNFFIIGSYFFYSFLPLQRNWGDFVICA